MVVEFFLGILGLVAFYSGPVFIMKSSLVFWQMFGFRTFEDAWTRDHQFVTFLAQESSKTACGAGFLVFKSVMVKRPASSASSRSSIGALQRENAKLKNEIARLRGETREKPPAAPNASEAYVTGLCEGVKYTISFNSEGFDQHQTSELYQCLSESIRAGRDFELTLKGGKKLDLKKTFSKNGIQPNSFVYVRYTSPPLQD